LAPSFSVLFEPAYCYLDLALDTPEEDAHYIIDIIT
jgi:hypothetical protein